MKATLDWLNEQKEMACHNLLCYSKTYAMDTPKDGMEQDFTEALRDVEILEELISIKHNKSAVVEALNVQYLEKQHQRLSQLFTNKDLFCLFQHLQEFFNQANNEVVADFGIVCENCKFLETCKCNWSETAEKSKLVGYYFKRHIGKYSVIPNCTCSSKRCDWEKIRKEIEEEIDNDIISGLASC